LRWRTCDVQPEFVDIGSQRTGQRLLIDMDKLLVLVTIKPDDWCVRNVAKTVHNPERQTGAGQAAGE
jgi:hypothetical protein